jgi:hypothetical protein
LFDFLGGDRSDLLHLLLGRLLLVVLVVAAVATLIVAIVMFFFRLLDFNLLKQHNTTYTQHENSV